MWTVWNQSVSSFLQQPISNTTICCLTVAIWRSDRGKVLPLWSCVQQNKWHWCGQVWLLGQVGLLRNNSLSDVKWPKMLNLPWTFYSVFLHYFNKMPHFPGCFHKFNILSSSSLHVPSLCHISGTATTWDSKTALTIIASSSLPGCVRWTWALTLTLKLTLT